MINQDLSIKSVILQSAGLQHPWSYIESREAFRRTLNLADLVGKNFELKLMHFVSGKNHIFLLLLEIQLQLFIRVTLKIKDEKFH